MVFEICHPPGRERCLGALRTQRSNLRPSACYASESEDSPWQPLVCRFGSERDRTAQKRWGRENVQGESLKESHLTSPCSCHQILYSLRKACHAAGPSGCFCPPSFLLLELKTTGVNTTNSVFSKRSLQTALWDAKGAKMGKAGALPAQEVEKSNS